jgi:hypothetical protein
MILSNFSSFKDDSKNIIILLLFVALIFLMETGVDFPNSLKFKFNISKFPVPRILMLTYIRSGSSFWAIYYKQIPEVSTHTNHFVIWLTEVECLRIELKKLLIWSNIYSSVSSDHWINTSKILIAKRVLIRNHYFWSVCDKIKMCSNTDFIEKTFNRSILQLMKVTRLHMKYLDTLLPYMSGSNFHVIYLVCDPRGIIKSE